MSLALPVFAQEKADQDSVVVPVESQSEAQRQVAFESAIHEWVDLHAHLKPATDISDFFAHPERYVESYSYLSGSDQEEGLKMVVHFDHDALAQFFPPQPVTQSQTLNLQIAGIDSAATLQALMHYLSQINTIKSILIEKVEGDTVVLSVNIQGAITIFVQTLLLGQHLVTIKPAESTENQMDLRFKWLGE